MSKSTFLVKNDELNELSIENTPDRIYLNMGNLYVGRETKYNFEELEDITWCSNSSGSCDIEYIRKDLVENEFNKFFTSQKELAKQLEKLNIAYEFGANGTIKIIN